MQENNILEYFLLLTFTFASCMLFYLIGALLYPFLRNSDEQHGRYAGIFFPMLLGMISLTSLYAVFMTSGKTSLVFVLILLAWLLAKRKHYRVTWSLTWKTAAEIFVISTLITIVLNILPESEYKQKDSFFYLKISEALQTTGQENTNQYYNLFNNKFNGVELYHHIELWLNGLLGNFFSSALPGIVMFRIVTYAVLSVTFILGLFHLAETLRNHTPGFTIKLICFTFLFFSPDILPYLPGQLQQYLVFSFDNNFIERPNLRITYLFLIPVISLLIQQRTSATDRSLVFYLACLMMTGPTVFIPVLVTLCILYLAGTFNPALRIFQNASPWLVLMLFVLGYAAFYFVFSGNNIPAMYSFEAEAIASYFHSSWKYLILTTVTGLVYSAAIIFITGWITNLFDHNIIVSLRRNMHALIFLSMLIVVSIVVARAGDFLDNVYQVAFTGYVSASLIILIFFFIPAHQSKKYFSLIIIVFFNVAGFITLRIRSNEHGDIFKQNGIYSYHGKKYSEKYIRNVLAYMKKANNKTGAYIADSSYYEPLYYSARNPNVYHLPISYIIAANTKTNNDFCLSSAAAITHRTPVDLGNNRYLQNALQRSLFHQAKTSVSEFIRSNNISYLVVTAPVNTDSLQLKTEAVFADENTGERFIILQ